jgi:outer membrane lipoprotein-sorting protein
MKRRLAAGFAFLVVIGAVLSTGASAPAPEGERELDSLLQKLAQVGALSAHFREEKRILLLAAPLVNEGTLYYQKPRKLARHTDTPHRASMLLEDNVLSFGDGTRTERLALDTHPAVGALVDTFISLLGGDRTGLARIADLTLEKPAEVGWRVRVKPKEAKVRAIVREMVFEGVEAQVSKIEFLDANGDTTVTTFSQLSLQARFSPAEAARIFRIRE